MNPEELQEWRRDIHEAEHSVGGQVTGGSLIRALFKTSQNINSVRSGIGHLTTAVREKLSEEIKQLNDNLTKASADSKNLANALNQLTRWGVIIAGAGLVFSVIQFLHSNRLWSFIQ